MMRNVKGFTLIEIMIAMAILGILMAISYPSYISHIQKSRRETAKADLLASAQLLERFYAINYTYSGASAGSGGTISASSPSSGTAFYTIGLSDLTATSYTLSATPISGGPQASDKCGTLSIDQAGNKSAAEASCW